MQQALVQNGLRQKSVQRKIRRLTAQHLKDDVIAAAEAKKTLRRTKSNLRGGDSSVVTPKTSTAPNKTVIHQASSTATTKLQEKAKAATSQNPFSALKSIDSQLYQELLRKAQGRISASTKGAQKAKQPTLVTRKSNMV